MRDSRIKQELLAPLRELAERLFPLRNPFFDIAAALDQLAVTRAAGQEIDRQSVGNEFVCLAAPVELLPIHVASNLHAPESRAIRLERCAIRYVQLNATTDFAGVLLKR